MDPQIIEEAPSDAGDNERAARTVSVPEMSHYSSSDGHSNLNNNNDAQINLSPSREALEETTPKQSQAILAPNDISERPPMQRSMSAAASYHRSRTNVSAGHSTPSAAPTNTNIAPADEAPMITVVPSSPLTSTGASRHGGMSQTHGSGAELSARGRDSTSERRSSRRRSEIDPASNRRLSGFFSNLLHLRERDSMPPSVPHHQTTTRPPQPPPLRPRSPPINYLASQHHRAQSEPLPPALPPPTLAELGLSLSALTDRLSSHQFTAPTSGTLLSPNYLLLCHSQGLDVMPLSSPPAIQPYALVRRVAFKSVVVMEERGVMVAIAGRRDGVRVYALEEIKKAVEWRIEVELRREMERYRREEIRRLPLITTIPNAENQKNNRKSASIDSLTGPAKASPGKRTIRRGSKATQPPPLPPMPMLPPSFPPQKLVPRTSVANFHIHRHANSRARSTSVAEAMGPQVLETNEPSIDHGDGKGEWVDVRQSDDEVLIAAGPSGSAALDERTSAISAAAASQAVGISTNIPGPVNASSAQRRRPSNLNLSAAAEFGTRPALGSPAPTLMTLRQALNQSPPTAGTMGSDPDMDNEPGTPNGEVISFAEALLESRLPGIPPIGQQAPRPAPAALVTRFPLSSRSPSSHGFGGQGLRTSLSTPLIHQTLNDPNSGGIVDADPSDQETDAEAAAAAPPPRAPSRGGGSMRASNRRHRWSVLDGVLRTPSTRQDSGGTTRGEERDMPRSSSLVPRTMSDADLNAPHTARSDGHRASASQPATLAETTSTVQRSNSSRFSGFFHLPKRSMQRSRASSNVSSTLSHPHPALNMAAGGSDPKLAALTTSQLPPQAPPPKLEYVKLPGTKGAIMIKAVETAKKSFLAILCGDNGEKVELFAGTYRTALGLSRTFILPDSPKTLELQLQGDDLVEVFLVFSQNVFGLEPATVRVREVRIGRAERRAARRRANRGHRIPTEDYPTEAPMADEEVGLTAVVAASEGGHDDAQLYPNAASRNDSRRPSAVGSGDGLSTPQFGNSAPSSASAPQFPSEVGALPPLGPPSTPHPDEIATAALIAMGPYTTFQQLSFAPPFPLASLAEECIIPPTYQAVLDYKKDYEREEGPLSETAETDTQSDTTPPTLDLHWYYKDPRDIVRGPWASSLMQSWFKDNFLPPDLPVRRENETEYISLQELQRQSIDPNSPFRPPPPGLSIPVGMGDCSRPEGLNPLLDPISILKQERRLGPPALFFSSRGGHSTSIVDARGRSVLKGRLHWTTDDASPHSVLVSGRLGDVKRLEAFGVADKTIVAAFRQNGLEVADVGDATMTPGDGCRTVYPYFDPPTGTYNRRGTFIWRTGQPIVDNKGSSTASAPSTPSKLTSMANKRRSLNASQLLYHGKVLNSRGGLLSEDDESTAFPGAQEELLVLGRSQDKVYFCDRGAGSFRLMSLSSESTVDP